MRAVDVMASAERFGFQPQPLAGLLSNTAASVRGNIVSACESEARVGPDAAGVLVLSALFVGALSMAPTVRAAEMRHEVDILAGSLGHLVAGGPRAAAEFVLGVLDGKTGAPPTIAALTAIAAVCRAVDDAGCLALLLQGFRPQSDMAQA